jgi:hypothetical protein
MKYMADIDNMNFALLHVADLHYLSSIGNTCHTFNMSAALVEFTREGECDNLRYIQKKNNLVW